MMMKRSAFLKGLLAQGAWMGLQRGDGPEAPASGAVLLRATLRGHRYHDGPHVLDRLRVGDALQLVREPENDFDEHAVAVHWKGAHLGYLPREHNRVVANLLDQGVGLRAELVMLRDVEHAAPCVAEVRWAA
jgi:hypothetical protein